MNILIVEDDVLGRDALTRLLKRAGHDVSSAFTAEAAIRWLAASAPPDVVLLDIDLGPGLTGWAVAGYMQSVERLSATRIIVVSGMAPDDVRAGAVSYVNRLTKAALILGKPTDTKALLLAITNIGKKP